MSSKFMLVCVFFNWGQINIVYQLGAHGVSLGLSLGGGVACKWMNDIKPSRYLIMAVVNQFGLTISNRSDTFMSYTINKLDEFNAWMLSIKDRQTRFRLIRRVNRIENGLFGDSGPVGEDVQELREFFGPGWRMYFIKLDEVFVFMLYGGDKSSQAADIAIAKQLARNLKGCLQ